MMFTQILSGIFELIKGRVELKKTELENKQRLMAAQDQYNSEWEMASLRDKDKWLRWLCFILFAYPFIHAWFMPETVEAYFSKALSKIPDWYTQTFIGMVGGVWGISSLKNVVPEMVGGTYKTIKQVQNKLGSTESGSE